VLIGTDSTELNIYVFINISWNIGYYSYALIEYIVVNIIDSLSLTIFQETAANLITLIKSHSFLGLVPGISYN
jgi:hypothetical protein